jgi:hypothetical protein
MSTNKSNLINVIIEGRRVKELRRNEMMSGREVEGYSRQPQVK